MPPAYPLVIVNPLNLAVAASPLATSIPSYLWQFCPLHLAVLKHKNITTTLPAVSNSGGLEAAGNRLKAKAAIPLEMAAFTLGPGPGLERGNLLWL